MCKLAFDTIFSFSIFVCSGGLFFHIFQLLYIALIMHVTHDIAQLKDLTRNPTLLFH